MLLDADSLEIVDRIPVGGAPQSVPLLAAEADHEHRDTPLRRLRMTLVREVVHGAAVGVGVTDTPEGLGVIAQPGVAAAIWRREPAPSFQAWMDRLDPDHLPRGRLTLRPAAARSAVGMLCDRAGMPPGPERARLVDDIAALAAVFAEIMATASLRLRLDVVATTPCPKFHIDSVTARLVCTYRGPGTEYGISTDGDEPRRVFRVPTGAPILLRGRLWPEGPPSGLLHRSPRLEGTDETRLVLVLDPGPAAEITDVAGPRGEARRTVH